MYYQAKPVKAIIWDGDINKIKDLNINYVYENKELFLFTKKGLKNVKRGNYVVKEFSTGNVYAVDKKLFEKSFMPLKEDLAIEILSKEGLI